MAGDVKYTDAEKAQFKEDLLDWMESGGSMNEWCGNPANPSEKSIRTWRKEDPEFHDAIPRARAIGCDALAEQCIAIADDVDEDPARSRVKVDTRLRLMGKWNRAAYGDKVDHHHQVEQIERIEMVLVKPPMRDITPEAKQIEAPDDPET